MMAWEAAALWVTENKKSRYKGYENEGLKADEDMSLKGNTSQ